MKATEEAINIQAEAARSDQRFENAARDIDHFVQNTQKLKSEDTNFTSSGTWNTASGTTSIKVTKDSSKLWIIVVIALAVLVLFLLTKR